MVGKNKLGHIPSISIYANGKNNYFVNTFLCDKYKCDSLKQKIEILGDVYKYVYWRINGAQSDTVFWNHLGYIGSKSANGYVKRIK